MASWQLKVQRYSPKGGETRISGTVHINGDTFEAAVSVAQDRIAGMKAADPEREYRIVHLLSHDYRGVDCEGGCHMFETAEEFSARVADKA